MTRIAWAIVIVGVVVVMALFGTGAMAANNYMMRYMVVSFMPAFGISAESIRVALMRLRDRGTIESDERGLYRLAAPAQAKLLRAIEERAITRVGENRPRVVMPT